MDNPRPLFSLILTLFQQTTHILQQINVKNVRPVSGDRNLNSQPYHCESPHLTTGPGFDFRN